MESMFRPSGYEEPVEKVELQYDDDVLEEAVLDPEKSRDLYIKDPVLWMRSAIGVDTRRGASNVTDRELATAHNEGGFAEWDPHVATAMAQHLTDMGFFVARSTKLDIDTADTVMEQQPEPTDGYNQLARMMIEHA